MDRFGIIFIISLGAVCWYGETRNLNSNYAVKRQIIIEDRVIGSNNQHKLRVRKQVESEEVTDQDDLDNAINEFFYIKPGTTEPPTGYVQTNCTLSEWSEWGECMRSPVCENEMEKHLKSYRKPQGRFDSGAKIMRGIMRMKNQLHAEREECQDLRSCPELDRRDSEGPVNCTEGMATIYPCRHVDQMSFLNLYDLGYKKRREDDRGYMANDVWGWTDPKDGQEYVIVGISGGTSFVRITPDPTNPQVLGFLPTRTSSSGWRDIKVVNHHAYIVSEAQEHGMQVFDLTRLRNMSTNSDNILSADAVYTEFGNAHNIVENPETGFVYIVGARKMNWNNGTEVDYPLHCSGGLHIVDVSEPKNPRFVTCFYQDGYVHDAQCVIYKGPDKEFYGRELCFNYNEDTLTIVDVTDKKRMKMISRTGYERTGYTHQGWLTEDHATIFMNDELDERMGRTDADKYTRTLIWDVRSLTKPELVREHLSGVMAMDHNLYTRGNFVYESNYQAGLRILHFNPDGYHLMEVAYFDVFPESDKAQSGGTWSNYPYFESGVVPVTSIEFGLFLVLPHYEKMEAQGQSHSVYGEQWRKREIIYTNDGKNCPRRLESRECDPSPCA